MVDELSRYVLKIYKLIILINSINYIVACSIYYVYYLGKVIYKDEISCNPLLAQIINHFLLMEQQVNRVGLSVTSTIFKVLMDATV